MLSSVNGRKSELVCCTPDDPRGVEVEAQTRFSGWICSFSMAVAVESPHLENAILYMQSRVYAGYRENASRK